MSLSRALSRVVARAAYPTIIIVSVTAADAALSHGASPSLVVSGGFLAVLTAIAVLERAMPFDEQANPGFRESRQDAIYLGLAALLQPIAKLGGTLVATWVTLSFAAVLGARGWAFGGPWWVKIGLALALADLAKYWVHRIAHERPAWWRFHAEHHAPERVYSLNGVRLHPVNLLWNLTLDAAPPLVFGLDARSIVLVAVLRGTVAVLQHANVDLRLAPLNWIFSTPDLHRWHHSTALAEASSNYGSTLIVWDVLFGTRRLPDARRSPVATGLADGAPHPEGIFHQLLWPWCGSKADRCPQLRGWKPRSPRRRAPV